MKKLLLVDGHSILNRAFYGLPIMTNSKGEYTNAILGFINIVLKIIDEEKPTHLAIAFDVHHKTFRHFMFEAYKGTRSKMPDELRSQVPMMKNVLEAMDVTVLECKGFEADDIIGTFSRKGEEAGMQVVVLSGDRDLLQLATNQVLIKIPKTKAGKTTVENYYADDVKALYGVNPREFIDMKGLMGDSSDNIPGVPGIGEKTASKLIQSFHSIEEAYQHIEEVKPNKAKENLKAYYDQAILSKELATIKLDVPLDYNIEEFEFHSMFTKEAYEYVKNLELKSLLKYFENTDKSISIQFETRIIADLVEMEQCFVHLKTCSCVGVFPLIEDKEFLGIGITKKHGEAQFILSSMFITQELIVSRFLQLMNENPNLKLITNDLKKLLKIIPFEMTNRIDDVALAAYLLNPSKDGYGYDDLARDYLGMTLPTRKELIEKQKISVISIQDDKILNYLSYEICVPFMVFESLYKEIEKADMLMLYQEIELPTVYVLHHMEQEGIRVDGEALKKYGENLNISILSLEEKIYKVAGEKFNINSPKQLGEILFDKMKLPGAKKTKTGYSTNVDVLNKLKNDYPIVSDILEYRQLTKLKSTYAEGLFGYIMEDGRIHGTFNQTITATGRISSTEPNLQNIPMRTDLGRSIRKVFIPREDYVFVDADYSQIELRVLAHFSKDEKLIKAYNENLDIHALTASQVFHVDLDEVDDVMRRNAKAVNFGIVYGISAFGLSEDLNISKKDAANYIESYFTTYPGVKQFLDQTITDSKNTGVTKTLFGRIRQIPELSSSNFMQRNFGERIAMNSPIQGTAADIIKIAMIRVYLRLKREKRKSTLILQIHDELLIETHKEEVFIVKKILEEEMMHAVELFVPLCVDVNVGDSWYDAK